jgi:hypothetical protein
MLGLSEIQRPVMCRCAKEPVLEQQEPDVDYAGQHKGLLLPDDYSAAVHLTVSLFFEYIIEDTKSTARTAEKS